MVGCPTSPSFGSKARNAIVIADAFAKKSRSTPKAAITRAARRFRVYDEAVQ